MKELLIILILLPLELISQNKDKLNLYSLIQGNQSELVIYAEVNQQWLDSVNKKYQWDNFNQYDNKLWEYMYKLHDEVVDKSEFQTEEELWNKFNRSQKIFWSFLAFGGDTDNGGVYQFLLNRPEHAISVLEVWEELGIEELKRDYSKVLSELFESKTEVKTSREIFNQDLSWNELYQPFEEDKKKLPSALKIEDYFYEKEFKRYLFQKMVEYIENNIEQFARIK